MTWRIEEGDCVERMRALPDESIDSIVCDPPYGLSKEPDAAEVLRHWLAGDDYKHRGAGFMGRSWDSFVPGPVVWREAYRVLKPGGHLVAFFGSRTVDLGGIAIRLAGFEIRDQLQWLYGSGFPKSLDVSKAIDKRRDWTALHALQGAIRDARATLGITQSEAARRVGMIGPDESLGGGGFMWFETGMRVPTRDQWPALKAALSLADKYDAAFEAAERESLGEYAEGQVPGGFGEHRFSAVDREITAPLSDEGRRWAGWGTALKPAHEPIVLARKPLAGTVAATVLAHGTGALNVDGCRIGSTKDVPASSSPGGQHGKLSPTGAEREGTSGMDPAVGRWPANVLLDEVAAGMLDEQTGETSSNAPAVNRRGATTGVSIGGQGRYGTAAPQEVVTGYGDNGGASRFLYVAKASTAERNAGLDGFEVKRVHRYSAKGQGPLPQQTPTEGTLECNTHPTVKPIDVMRWLARLVTPPGGTILDPYTGSGTTGIAAALEGFDFVGFELQGPEWVLDHPDDDDHVAIARARVEFWARWPVGTKTAAILAEIGVDRVEGVKADAARDARAEQGQVSMFDLLDAA